VKRDKTIYVTTRATRKEKNWWQLRTPCPPSDVSEKILRHKTCLDSLMAKTYFLLPKDVWKGENISLKGRNTLVHVCQLNDTALSN